jgi:transposase
VKLASVATDITGVSGRAILQALLDGEEDPEVLAELARGRMRSKRDQLAQAVQGTMRDHHRFPAQEPTAPTGLLRHANRGVGSGDCSPIGCADRSG